MVKYFLTVLTGLAVSVGLVFAPGCQGPAAPTRVGRHGDRDVETGSALAAASDRKGARVQFRRITVKDYVDKMKAGWIGQIAGVSWGAPTEFRFKGRIIPEDKMPKWQPKMINNAFGQDDIYVEMTFLRSLELYGLDVSGRQVGIDFANSRYRLWHANNAGRENLRAGIAPPDSGHPEFNKHADDIDYQIESDFAGLISPGLGGNAVALGEKFGRLMNYGDGLYGGQFVAGMYAEAFFETDSEKIILAGLKCIPQRSQYYECINDVLKWYKANPDDWQKTWQLIEDKYNRNPDYRRSSCSKEHNFNIDAKINGAYIVMGLLYGRGDPDETTIIATRCGQDSDCNPSSAAGVLFTTIGFSKLPGKFTAELCHETKFRFTAYNFGALTEVCEKLARQVVLRAGGRIEKNNLGEEVFVIPALPVKPGRLEQCFSPEPIANSRFTEDELAQIIEPRAIELSTEKFAPGWKVINCGPDMDPGLHEQLLGRKSVFVTHPLDRNTPCVLASKLEIPPAKKTVLQLVVGHHPEGDWTLIVKADGKELVRKSISKDNSTNGFLEADVDLSAYAGRTINVELLNQPNGWHYEAAYWDKIKLAAQE